MVFLAVAIMTTWVAYATAKLAAVPAPAKVQAGVANANMHVVVVAAKRLTAQEKAGLK